MVLEKPLKWIGDSRENPQQGHSNLSLYSTAYVPRVMRDGETPANPNICHGPKHSHWHIHVLLMTGAGFIKRGGGKPRDAFLWPPTIQHTKLWMCYKFVAYGSNRCSTGFHLVSDVHKKLSPSLTLHVSYRQTQFLPDSDRHANRKEQAMMQWVLMATFLQFRRRAKWNNTFTSRWNLPYLPI